MLFELHIKEHLLSARILICRSSKYLEIEELSADQRNAQSEDLRIICKLFTDWEIICISKHCVKTQFNLQIEKLFHLQIKELSGDQINLYRLRNNFQTKKLQIKRISTDQKIIWILKNYLRIEEISVDRRTIRRLKNYLQIM